MSKMTEEKLSSIQAVLILNRDVVEAYQKKGVEYWDVALICEYALRYLQSGGK